MHIMHVFKGTIHCVSIGLADYMQHYLKHSIHAVFYPSCQLVLSDLHTIGAGYLAEQGE